MKEILINISQSAGDLMLAKIELIATQNQAEAQQFEEDVAKLLDRLERSPSPQTLGVRASEVESAHFRYIELGSAIVFYRVEESEKVVTITVHSIE